MAISSNSGLIFFFFLGGSTQINLKLLKYHSNDLIDHRATKNFRTGKLGRLSFGFPF